MTTPEDRLFDELCDVAADYLMRKGITTGVQKLAQVMQQAAVDHLAESSKAANPVLVAKLASAESALSNFDRLLRAEQLRISILQAGSAPLGTEPQS